MKTASRITLTFAVMALLAAIWAPGPWWSWLLTAIVLLFVGAGLAGSNVHEERYNPRTGHLEGELLPEHVAREFVAPSTLEQITPDDVDAYKRTYGRSTDR